jgi:hypothetical protein
MPTIRCAVPLLIPLFTVACVDSGAVSREEKMRLSKTCSEMATAWTERNRGFFGAQNHYNWKRAECLIRVQTGNSEDGAVFIIYDVAENRQVARRQEKGGKVTVTGDAKTDDEFLKLMEE